MERRTTAILARKEQSALEGKGQDMDSKELDKIAQKARRETEDFLNNHIHDSAKGWPVSCPSRADSAGPRQVQQVTTRSRIRMQEMQRE